MDKSNMIKASDFKLEECKSWEKTKSHLLALSRKKRIVFRGEPEDHKTALTTTLDRFLKYIPVNKFVIEPYLLEEFQRRYGNYSQIKPEQYNRVEWWSFMQHYGGPTRLLDWTYSFYVAVFFALENLDKINNKAVVWALDADWLEDVLDYGEHGNLKAALAKDPHMSKIKTFCEFDGKQMILRMTPSVLHERLSVQQGCFLMSGSPKVTFMQNLRKCSKKKDLKKYLFKFTFPKGPKERKEILRDLFRMNISRASLFPGLDGYAASFKTSTFSEPKLLEKRAFEERIVSDYE